MIQVRIHARFGLFLLFLILSHQSADIYADIYNARICLNALCRFYSESMLVEINIYEFKFTMLIRLSYVNWRRYLQSLVAQTMKRFHGQRLELGTLLSQKGKSFCSFEDMQPFWREEDKKERQRFKLHKSTNQTHV